jgi:hypothetical protein
MPALIPISRQFQAKATALAEEMASWESKPRVDAATEKAIRKAIRGFQHCNSVDEFRIAGVDGSGDYPSFSYADSFVYVATASGAVFRTDTVSGLVEEKVLVEPNLELVWLPEDAGKAQGQWLAAFKSLAGVSVEDVIKNSDYAALKKAQGAGGVSVDDLVLPRASDTANCGIQLRSVAEWGTCLRLVEAKPSCRYVLMDTTMSLPFVKTKDSSLFHEHLKRFCCVRARENDLNLFTVSKSHSLPSIELLENLAKEALGVPKDKTAEHWFIRLPMEGVDDWEMNGVIEGRQIPPVGAVSYVLRLHRNTPVMRLDMDRAWWEKHYRGDKKAELKVFQEIDYCGHDQRAYGYPFPIKACHDRTRLSMAERVVLRKQIIDAAVSKGMKRSLFKDASTATGHN